MTRSATFAIDGSGHLSVTALISDAYAEKLQIECP